MSLKALILSALVAPLAWAMPRAPVHAHHEAYMHQTRTAAMRQVELYTPTYTMLNPLSWSHQKSPSARIKCRGAGPQCLDFPGGVPRNESVGVRVYCVAIKRKQGQPGYDDDPAALHRYDLRPAIMYPCARGAHCNLTIDESKRPQGTAPATPPSPPPPHPLFARDGEDDWMWFENDEGDVPGLSGLGDVSSWIHLEGLVRQVDFDDDDNDGDNGNGDGDYSLNYEDLKEINDWILNHFTFDEYLGNLTASDYYSDDSDDDDDDNDDDITSGAKPKILTIPDPIPNGRLPFPPKTPWYTFTCVVGDDYYDNKISRRARD